MKLFYDHLTVREEISKELRKYHLSVGEHIEFMQITDEVIHFEVLDVILENLPKEKHKEFLEKMHAAPYDKALIEYLTVEIDDIEVKIKERGQKAKTHIMGEIKKSQKK